MKIAISGACGFLGSHLVRALLLQGYSILALKRSSSSIEKLPQGEKLLSYADVDKRSIKEIFAEHSINGVIHAATCYGKEKEGFLEVFQSNVVFALALLQETLSAKIPYFLNIDTVLAKEVSHYAFCKKQFVECAQRLIPEGKTTFLNASLEQMYAEDPQYRSFLTDMARHLLKKVERLPLTQGEQMRDWIHIDDVIEGIMALWKQKEEIEKPFFPCAFGSGDLKTVREVMETLQKLTQSPTHLDWGALPYRPHELMRSETDPKQLAWLGWEPRRNLEESLKKLVTALQRET